MSSDQDDDDDDDDEPVPEPIQTTNIQRATPTVQRPTTQGGTFPLIIDPLGLFSQHETPEKPGFTSTVQNVLNTWTNVATSMVCRPLDAIFSG